MIDIKNTVHIITQVIFTAVLAITITAVAVYTYFPVYSLSAQTPVVILEVEIPECRDTIDNDGDGTIDRDDSSCHSDNDVSNFDSYDGDIIKENSTPLITLVEDTSLTFYPIAHAYNDPGFSAYDSEEGDITNRVVVGGDVVNIAVEGTYLITYNVTDGGGVFAQELTRMVTVDKKYSLECSVTPGEDPLNPRFLSIFNESMEVINNTAVIISWDTNLQSTSLVYYGTTSQEDFFENIYSGYGNVSNETLLLEMKHAVLINNLDPQMSYYFRVASNRSNEGVFGVEAQCTSQTSVTTKSIESRTTPTNGVCSTTLTQYLRADKENNREEVIKLQNFLRDVEGFSVELTGIYDEQTIRAVNEFQLRYKEDILEPWGITEPTGYVYYTTQKKINELLCTDDAISLTTDQLAEIVAYRKLVETQVEIDTSIVGLGVDGVEFNTNDVVAGDDDEFIVLGEEEDNNEKDDDSGDESSIIASVGDRLDGLGFSNTTQFLAFIVLLIIFIILITRRKRNQKQEIGTISRY